MQFGILYEHSCHGVAEGAELKLFQEALDQVELADRLASTTPGRSSITSGRVFALFAPEVFLALARSAPSASVGSRHRADAAGYNHPARVAERIATLDLSREVASIGHRTGASAAELGGFGIHPDERHAAWLEAPPRPPI